MEGILGHVKAVARVTLIAGDDLVERIRGGRVGTHNGRPAVRVDSIQVPGWAAPGVDVVAAHPDGSVETAFTAHDVELGVTTGLSSHHVHYFYSD